MEHNHECLHYHGHEHHEQHAHHEHAHAIEFHPGDLCSKGLCSHIEHRGAQLDLQMRISLEAQLSAVSDNSDEENDGKPKSKKDKKRRYNPVLVPQG